MLDTLKPVVPATPLTPGDTTTMAPQVIVHQSGGLSILTAYGDKVEVIPSEVPALLDYCKAALVVKEVPAL